MKRSLDKERSEIFDYFSDELVQVNEGGINGRPPNWPEAIKRYLQGELRYQFWFRVGRDPYPTYFRAQLQCVGVKDRPNDFAIRAVEMSLVSGRKRNMGSAMFVVVPETVEYPKLVPLSGAPSRLRLERLKVIEHRESGLVDRFDLPFCSGPLVRDFTNGKLGIVSWTERVNEVIETRAKAMNTVSENKLEVSWERCRFIDDIVDIGAGLRLHLRERNPVVVHSRGSDIDFECLQMIPGPRKPVDYRFKVPYPWHDNLTLEPDVKRETESRRDTGDSSQKGQVNADSDPDKTRVLP